MKRSSQRPWWCELIAGRGRFALFAVIAVVTVLFGRLALTTRLELSNESMNARNPVQAQIYDEFKRQFGSDEVLIVSLTHPELFTVDGLRMLSDLTERVAKLDGVAHASSLANWIELVPGEFGAEEAPLLPALDATFDPQTVLEALARNPFLIGLLVSADRRTAGVAVEPESRPGDDRFRARLIATLRSMKQEDRGDDVEVHLTGIAIQKHDATRFVQRDQRLILPLSVLIMAVLLGGVTRRRSGVLLPLGVTGVTLIWTLGLYAGLGYTVNIITSLLPPVVLVLSVTSGMHLYQEWIHLARKRDPEADSTSREARAALALDVVRSLGIPVILTAVTTAIGLASLGLSAVPAVKQFGLFAALGVLSNLVLSLTLFPAVLSLLRPPDLTPRRASAAFRGLLEHAARLSIERPRSVLLVAGLLLLVAIPGISRIRNNTDLVRFLDPSAELYRDTLFIDRHLVGANSLELVVRRIDGSPLTTPGDVLSLERLMTGIEELEDVTAVLGLSQLIAQVHRAEFDTGRLAVPRDPDELLDCFDLIEASDRQSEIRGLVTSDFTTARINARVHAIGTAEAEQLLARIAALSREVAGTTYEVTPTGSFYLVTTDSNRLVTEQLESFGAALGLILVVMGFAFRQLKLLVAALIPNVVPIVWTAGLMGWLGIDLSTATAMVASVVLGVAVDGTIHYLSRFQRENHGDVAAAIRSATLRTGRALTLASFVLAVGFWVGALGSFRPTMYFSLLTGATILSALICDLLVLPACLMVTRPPSRRSP